MAMYEWRGERRTQVPRSQGRDQVLRCEVPRREREGCAVERRQWSVVKRAVGMRGGNASVSVRGEWSSGGAILAGSCARGDAHFRHGV